MRYLVIIMFLVVLSSTVAYSASMTATISTLGGGTTTVSHTGSTCEVGTSDANVVSDAIDTVTATLTCDNTGTYSVQAVVVSGASISTNSNTVSLTAGAPGPVTIDTNPNIDVSGTSGYTIAYTVTLQ